MNSPETNEERDAEARAALQTLIHEYAGQLFSLGVRFCGNRSEAEDLVQEVFLQAFRSWHTFEGRSSPKTWLYTIAARTCQRMHRKRAGQPDSIPSLDVTLPFGDPLIAVIPSEQEGPLQQQIQREARDRIEAEIARLPESFRVPLVLKEIVGLTVPEVAAILGLEEGTIKSRVHRARLRLRVAVDAALPRQPDPAPPPAYSRQTCLDLLNAKQEALDRGVDLDSEVICQRCRSVFASLDLSQEICRQLGRGQVPPDLQQRLQESLETTASD